MRDNDLEKRREYQARYRSQHKEEIAEKKKQYRLNNREAINEKDRLYYARNKKKCKDWQREYNAENMEQVLERNRQYQINNKERLKEYYRACSKAKVHNLTDDYVIQRIKYKKNIETKDIPDELIDLYRINLQLQRRIRHEKNS